METQHLELTKHDYYNEKKPALSSRPAYVGLVSLVCFIIFVSKGQLYPLGAMLLGALAAMLVGAMFGFLFGIPRSLALARGMDGETGGSSGFSHNTNLEQISDWLTKIVVGVGLVEAKKIAVQFELLAAQSAQAWGVKDGAVTAGAILLAGVVIGFLLFYIWTRTKFIEYLEETESNVARQRRDRLMDDLRDKLDRMELDRRHAEEEKQQAAAESQKKSEDIEALAEITRSMKAAVLRAPSAFSSADTYLREMPAAIDSETQAQNLWASDPHKGKFGGSPVAHGRLLEAVVSPVVEDAAVCRVLLRVRAEIGQPGLSGRVTFHLHPTFSRPVVEVDVSPEGIAETEVLAIGVFTVGAETSDGVRLELDLASLAGLPERFRNT